MDRTKHMGPLGEGSFHQGLSGFRIRWATEMAKDKTQGFSSQALCKPCIAGFAPDGGGVITIPSINELLLIDINFSNYEKRL